MQYSTDKQKFLYLLRISSYYHRTFYYPRKTTAQM